MVTTANTNLAIVIGGADTGSIILAGFIYYLTRNPRVYDILTSEIRTKFSSVDEIHIGSKLSSCHYLRACIDEALRMCPPVPTDLPRVTLKGGATIDREFVPENICVGTSICALHYNERYHPDPWTFKPERWIVRDHVTKEDVARENSAFYPFSFGPGNCVGMKLAIMELSIAVARLLYKMDVAAVDSAERDTSMLKGTELENKHGLFPLKNLYVAQRDGPLARFKRR